MANKEVGELTAATVPLAGTELIHIVQGGNSRKATVADLGGGGGGGSTTIEEEIATSYSVDEDDLSGLYVKEMNNAAAITVTVTPDLANGEPCTFIQSGAGPVTFVAGAGVTLNASGGDLTLSGIWSACTLIKRSANNYVLIGDLTT